MEYNYFLEEKEIIECYLESDLFNKKRSFQFLNDRFSSSSEEFSNNNFLLTGIELIVRPQCNQKCEYCYITRYGNNLYPEEQRLTNEQIITRIDKLLDYIFNEKGIFINHWELFAGDLFYDDLAFDIFDIFYKHISNIYNKYRRIVSMPLNEGLILIPCNFSFIEDDEKTKKIEEYMEKFKKLNWELGFSISTDGPSAVDTREQRELSADHFDKLFQWTLKYPRNGFHAIISASNVKNSIEGYQWWKENFQKWYKDKEIKYDFLPYWLEARNDEWTDENISDYIKLLNFMFEDRLLMCDNNIDKMAYHLFCGDGKNNTLSSLHHNDLINLRYSGNLVDRQVTSCSLSHLLCLNLSNLNIVPCHRLTYPQFAGFKFIEKNDKIYDIEPINPSNYLTTVLHNCESRPKCSSCMLKLICHKGCLGAQYESSGELFYPAISVCKLNIEKCKFLINKYYTSGVLQSARKQKIIPPELDIVYSEILIQLLGYSEEDVYSE